MLSALWDVRGNPVNPLQGIESDRGLACTGIGRRLQYKGAIGSCLQGVHRYGGAGDVPGLRFEGLQLAGIDGWSGKD